MFQLNSNQSYIVFEIIDSTRQQIICLCTPPRRDIRVVFLVVQTLEMMENDVGFLNVRTQNCSLYSHYRWCEHVLTLCPASHQGCSSRKDHQSYGFFFMCKIDSKHAIVAQYSVDEVNVGQKFFRRHRIGRSALKGLYILSDRTISLFLVLQLEAVYCHIY